MPHHPLDHLEPELHRLYAVLREHPGGLREYQLLEILRGEAPVRGLDELGLFRVHFLLFHHLHRLRAALEATGLGSLDVHCLGIRLLPLQGSPHNPGRLPLGPDPLGEYYLDLGNLVRTTREEVRELLRWFWRRYRAHGRREGALEALGLGAGATPAQIRRRYRALVLENHPDRGGDPEAFRRVVEAAEVLRTLEKRPRKPDLRTGTDSGRRTGRAAARRGR